MLIYQRVASISISHRTLWRVNWSPFSKTGEVCGTKPCLEARARHLFHVCKTIINHTLVGKMTTINHDNYHQPSPLYIFICHVLPCIAMYRHAMPSLSIFCRLSAGLYHSYMLKFGDSLLLLY